MRYLISKTIQNLCGQFVPQNPWLLMVADYTECPISQTEKEIIVELYLGRDL